MSVMTREQAEKNRKNLSEANLSEANLSGANLSWANLSGANLSWADLSWADLNGANLSGADLYRADLYRADLNGANLNGANLSGANLSWANLYGANLSGANLSGANLSGANLSEANLSWANLYGVNLSGAKLPYFQIPQEGELIVWKKLRGKHLCKLLIPSSAKRTANLINRKCRAEYAEVLEIVGADGISRSSAFGMHNSRFKYTIGISVYADKYDPDIRIDCSGGIHFFLTKEEAKDYY